MREKYVGVYCLGECAGPCAVDTDTVPIFLVLKGLNSR